MCSVANSRRSIAVSILMSAIFARKSDCSQMGPNESRVSAVLDISTQYPLTDRNAKSLLQNLFRVLRGRGSRWPLDRDLKHFGQLLRNALAGRAAQHHANGSRKMRAHVRDFRKTGRAGLSQGIATAKVREVLLRR